MSTELEVVMTDWLVKMLGLPHFYLHNNSGGGGAIGVIASLVYRINVKTLIVTP